MNYNRYVMLFNSRAARRNYKVLFHGSLWLYKELDGTFLIKWAHDRGDFARIKPDNTAELLDKDRYYPSQATRWCNLVGFGFVGSEQSNKTYRARFKDGKVNVPFAKGLVVDMYKQTVISHATDTVKATDRKACGPVYEYVRKVGKMMDLLKRMGQLDAVAYDTRRWQYSYDNFNRFNEAVSLGLLTDEALVKFAEFAYVYGKTHSTGVDRRTFLTNEELAAAYKNDAVRLVVDRKIDEASAALARTCGLNHLRDRLKKLNPSSFVIQPVIK